MPTSSTRHAVRAHRVGRRVLTVAGAIGWLTLTTVVLAGPALAEPSEGWEHAPAQNAFRSILILAGIPLLLFVVIAGFVYLPAILRGERVAPGATPMDNQWLGGPRRAAGELAGPDTEASAAGGASGRW